MSGSIEVHVVEYVASCKISVSVYMPDIIHSVLRNCSNSQTYFLVWYFMAMFISSEKEAKTKFDEKFYILHSK